VFIYVNYNYNNKQNSIIARSTIMSNSFPRIIGIVDVGNANLPLV